MKYPLGNILRKNLLPTDLIFITILTLLRGLVFYSFLYLTDGKVIILEHPQGGTYRVGDQLKLICHAEGAQPLFYRWELNSMSLTHERRPQLYIPQLTTDDEGWYRCQVSNKFSRTYTNSCRVVVRNAI